MPWFVRAGALIDRVGLAPIKRQWDLPAARTRRRRDVIVALKEVPLTPLVAGLGELESEYGVAAPEPHGAFMGVEEVRTLAEGSVIIGSHTHRHPILSRLGEVEQRREIEENLDIIEAVSGRRPREFAYPNGKPHDFDDRTIEILRSSGIQTAFTTTQRYLRPSEDSFRVPRIGLSCGTSNFRTSVKHLVPSLIP